MPTVVGVRLRFSKTLWFDPAGATPAEGDLVIVETERGTEIGTVVQAPHEVRDDQLPAPLKPVARVATADDLEQIAKLEDLELEALPVFRSLVAEYGLDMKPIDVEYLLGGDKIVFYFSAEERVDFRDLVKDLASRFHARIDMRQVGVRDEARAVGGIGHCGQMLCCVRFGGDFQPVSIRMAKEQDLPLNPLKISGLCGRLMCCLRYEFDAYKDFKGRAPKKGAIVDTAVGLAKVTELNTPRETIGMRFEDGSRVTVPLKEMTCAKGSGCPCQVSRETLEAAGNAAAIALASDLEPAPMPEPMLRSDRGAAQKAGKDEKPAEKAGNGRKRRRRGGKPGGEGQGEAQAKSQPKQQPKQPTQQAGAPKQAGKAPADGAAADSAGGQGTPRRRRRRRRSGGGSGQSE
jgi:cell fate regulator YaaT (PSP1 superfamily)